MIDYKDGPRAIQLRAEIDKLERKLSNLEYKLSCIIEHATGGELSKTNYSKEQIYDAINRFLVEQRDEAFQEGFSTALEMDKFNH